MIRERLSRVVFGDDQPGVKALRSALDTIEADLTDAAEITIFGTGNGHVSVVVGTLREEGE